MINSKQQQEVIRAACKQHQKPEESRRNTKFICCTRKHSTGRHRQYTMQSSITAVCLSHAACTEQKSPQENTCTHTTDFPATLFRMSTSQQLTCRNIHLPLQKHETFKRLRSANYLHIHIRIQIIHKKSLFLPLSPLILTLKFLYLLVTFCKAL